MILQILATVLVKVMTLTLRIHQSDSSDIEEDATVSVLPLLEPHWPSSLQNTESPPFLSEFGPSHNLHHINNERDYFNLIFDDRCLTVLTEETNRYSRETQEKTGKQVNFSSIILGYCRF